MAILNTINFEVFYANNSAALQSKVLITVKQIYSTYAMATIIYNCTRTRSIRHQ
jgi:hypothetical protein